MAESTALRLADDLIYVSKYSDSEHWSTLAETAAELRRLHAEVNELKRTLALQQQSYEREIEIEVEAEREACANVCDARYMGDNNREDMEARRCAAAIRARGPE
jgi:hypothetical protein